MPDQARAVPFSPRREQFSAASRTTTIKIVPHPQCAHSCVATETGVSNRCYPRRIRCPRLSERRRTRQPLPKLGRRMEPVDSFRGLLLDWSRSEEHTSELQSQSNLVCRLLLEKKNTYLCYLSTSHLRSHL